jgi:hypothetical protein
MKKGLDRNANAMQTDSVLKDRKCKIVFMAYATAMLSLSAWCLVSTAGVGITIGILATHISYILCRFKAPHPRLFFTGKEFQNPASAGERNGVRPASPTPRRKVCIEC